MKSISISILTLLLGIQTWSQELHHTSTMDPGDLIWADEFEGDGIPDPGKWERQEYNRRNNDSGPDGWWSNEDSFLDGQGHLVITCSKIDNKNDDTDSCDFSTGMVRSKGYFEHLYGRFEIRCRLPMQSGWWVAFWMMQGNVGSEANAGVDGTEVDIMEAFGWNNRIQHAFHWDGYGDAHQSKGVSRYPSGIHDGFHTFSLEWYPEMYIFFIDGEESWRSTGGGVCNQAGYVKVTGEISTEAWAINNYWANDPADAVLPDSFIIDYVRVYEIGEYQYPAGFKQIPADHEFKIGLSLPNQQMYLKWNDAYFNGAPRLSIYNLGGQLVRHIPNVEAMHPYTVSDLPPGCYILNLSDSSKKLQQKIVIQ